VADYRKIIEDQKSVITNPVSTIADVAQAAQAEYDYLGAMGRLAEPAIQGSKVVGSKLMEVLAPLDKPRGFVEGARRAYFEEPSVMDERSTMERVIEGGVAGFKDPEFPEIPIPERFQDTAIGRTGEIGGGIAASIIEDPLTYTPAAVVSLPFKVATGIAKWVGGTKPVKSVLESGPVSNVLEALNIYTGDARKARDIIERIRLENRGQEILSQRSMSAENEYLQKMAADAGVEVSALKAAILQAAEANDFSKVKAISQDAVKFAGDERKFYEDLLKIEQSADMGTGDIMRRAEELGIGGYVPHVRNDTFTAKVKRLLSGKIGSQQQRQLAGTIAEINARKGTTFFMDDPTILKAMRLRWHNQMMLADRSLQRAATEFGKAVGSTKKGQRFDLNGDPIPDDWVVLKNHAYPPQVGKVLNQQYQLLKSPAKTSEVIKMYDEVQNWWKKYSLASRPAWHSRNAIGNFWNNYFIGGVTNPIVYGEAAAVQKAMQADKGVIVEKLDRLTGADRVDPSVVVNGTKMTREQIWNEAVKRGVYESGLYGQDLGQAAITSSNIPLSTEWSVINKAFAAGKTVENNARIALFIDQIRKGKSLDEAGDMVRKTLFDYSDLSDFEKRYAKRIMPFYTWSRKNIPAQLEAAMKNPDRAQKLNIIVGNMQNGVQRIDENDVEQWAKNQFPIFLNEKDSDQYYTFVTAMSYLPTAELERVFQDPEEIKKMMGDMTSPVLKVPFELFTNYNLFRDEVIDFSQEGYGIGKGETGEGIYPFRADTTRGSQEFLGIRVTPKEKHILSSLVLLSEVDRLNPFNVFGDVSSRDEEDTKSWAGVERQGQDIPESARWLRAMLGLRVYKREKGSAEFSRNIETIRQLKSLEQKIKSSKAMRNPELMNHLVKVLEATFEGAE